MSSSDPLNAAYGEHVMLLYNTEKECETAVADYIDVGLKKGQLCVYASVGAYGTTSRWHYSNLSSQIESFDENVNQGNLVILASMPLLEAARKGDPTYFNQLKSQLETMLKQRIADGKGNKLLAFADAGRRLSENNEFEETLKLETWWQTAHEEWTANHQNISVICPHPAAAFIEETATSGADVRAQIAAVHSVMLQAPSPGHYYQLGHPLYTAPAVARPIRRILVAESDEDTKLLYRLGFDLLGVKLTIVSTGEKCLDAVFKTLGNSGFDTIIVDTHLKDISGIEVARKIKQSLPDQRIIITTTMVSIEEIELLGISRDHVLEKPFRFSTLRALLSTHR